MAQPPNTTTSFAPPQASKAAPPTLGMAQLSVGGFLTLTLSLTLSLTLALALALTLTLTLSLSRTLARTRTRTLSLSLGLSLKGAREAARGRAAQRASRGGEDARVRAQATEDGDEAGQADTGAAVPLPDLTLAFLE